jgi:hypothetical protein
VRRDIVCSRGCCECREGIGVAFRNLVMLDDERADVRPRSSAVYDREGDALLVTRDGTDEPE